MLIFAKGSGLRNQRFERATSWEEAYEIIEERWGRGQDIIELEYAQGKWLMVFAMHTGFENQRYASRNRYEDFVNQARLLRTKGYYIVDLADGW